MFHEFPKSLYLKGDRTAAHVIAADAEEEANYRRDGFRMIAEPTAPTPEPVAAPELPPEEPEPVTPPEPAPAPAEPKAPAKAKARK